MSTSIPYDTMSVSSRSEPVFRKCCFCFPLRVGCLFLGYLNLVFNGIHTLALVIFTANYGTKTHGFDHFDFNDAFDDEDVKPSRSFEKSFLNQIELILIVGLCANIIWLLVNVACLIGLHNKRPGPIKMFVGFASARLTLSLAGFLYLAMTSPAFTHTIVSYSADLGLSAYFILVYYIYAIQLEQELKERNVQSSLPAIEKGPVNLDEKVNDIAFIYPIDVDKKILVA